MEPAPQLEEQGQLAMPCECKEQRAAAASVDPQTLVQPARLEPSCVDDLISSLSSKVVAGQDGASPASQTVEPPTPSYSDVQCKLLEDVVNRLLPAHGLSHIFTLKAIQLLAPAYAEEGEHWKAVELLRVVVRELSQLEGVNHAKTMAATCQLAGILMDEDLASQEATTLLGSVYEWWLLHEEQVSGGDEEAIAVSFHLFQLLTKQGNYNTKTVRVGQSVYAAQLANQGPYTPRILSTLRMLLGALGAAEQWVHAAQLVEGALANYRVGSKKRMAVMSTYVDAVFAHGGDTEWLHAKDLCKADNVKLKQLQPSQELTCLLGRSLSNTGVLLVRLAEWEEAVDVGDQVLSLLPQLSTQDGSEEDALSFLVNLVDKLMAEQEYGRAEPLLRRLLAWHTQSLGEDHDATLVTAAALCVALEEMGHAGEEVELRESIYERIKQAPAASTWGIVDAGYYLIRCLKKSPTKCAPQRMVALCEEVVGFIAAHVGQGGVCDWKWADSAPPAFPQAYIMWVLMGALQNLGRLDKAIDVGLNALASAEAAGGPGSSSSWEACVHIRKMVAAILMQCNRNEEAIDHLRICLSDWCNLKGSTSCEVLDTRTCLATCLHRPGSMERMGEVVEHLRAALEGWSQQGVQSKEMDCADRLAWCLFEMNGKSEMKEATSLLRQVRAWRVKTGDLSSDNALASTLCLARCLDQAYMASQTKHSLRAESLELYREACKGLIALYGPSHPHTISACCDMLLLLMCKFGLDDYKMVVEVWEPVHEFVIQQGEDCELAADATERIIIALRALGRHDLALPLMQRLLQLKRQQLGPRNREVKVQERNIQSALEAMGKEDSHSVEDKHGGGAHRDISASRSKAAPATSSAASTAAGSSSTDAERVAAAEAAAAALLAEEEAEAERVVRKVEKAGEKKRKKKEKEKKKQAAAAGGATSQQDISSDVPVGVCGPAAAEAAMTAAGAGTTATGADGQTAITLDFAGTMPVPPIPLAPPAISTQAPPSLQTSAAQCSALQANQRDESSDQWQATPHTLPAAQSALPHHFQHLPPNHPLRLQFGGIGLGVGGWQAAATQTAPRQVPLVVATMQALDRTAVVATVATPAALATAPAAAASSAAAAASIQAAQSAPARVECCVCLSMRMPVTFQPCGHAICCKGCTGQVVASTRPVCPFCGVHIQGIKSH